MADFIMYIMGVVNMWGYIGVFAATALEYACFPVSSEILLPFIGCCVYNGGKSLVGAVINSWSGSWLYSVFLYRKNGQKFYN